MSVSVTCPFCRSVFAIAEVPDARRTPCPHCGESVPVSADAPHAADPPTPAPADIPPPRTSNVVFISLALTALIVAGFVTWYYLGPQPPVSPSAPSAPTVVTPRALDGLKYIPKDSQLVAAIQPAAFDEYAKSKGRSVDELFDEFGLPADLLKQLRNAGLPPSAVRSIVLAANVDTLRVVLVLTLREPLKDEAKFRDALDAQGRDPVSVSVGGFPLVMAKANDKTYLFAINEDGLATAKAPTAGYDDLREPVRESVGQLRPSAVAWLATDNKEWAKLPQWKLVGDRVPFGGVAKLPGVRAVAVGVSLEPDLHLGLAVRVNDSSVARDTADTLRAKLADLNAYVVPSGEWAAASLSLEPTSETLPKLKDALKK